MMDIAMETAVLTKIRRLPNYRKQEVLNFIEFLESKLIPTAPSRSEQLATAAQALLADYESDPELTAFTALDGENFHA